MNETLTLHGDDAILSPAPTLRESVEHALAATNIADLRARIERATAPAAAVSYFDARELAAARRLTLPTGASLLVPFVADSPALVDTSDLRVDSLELPGDAFTQAELYEWWPIAYPTSARVEAARHGAVEVFPDDLQRRAPVLADAARSIDLADGEMIVSIHTDPHGRQPESGKPLYLTVNIGVVLEPAEERDGVGGFFVAWH